jgi:restriction system protein
MIADPLDYPPCQYAQFVPIPDYQSLMKPVLDILASSGVLSMRDLTERVSEELALTDDERRQTITSGMS